MYTEAAIAGLPVPPPGQGMLCKLDRSGHTETTWDPNEPEDVEVARAMFETLIGQGYLAFSVNEDGTKGEPIREFDPKASRIILSPPLFGG